MLRTKSWPGLAFFLTLAFVPAPIRAQGDAEIPEEKIRAIQKQLTDINVMLGKAFENVTSDIKALTRRVDEYKDFQGQTDVRLGAAEVQIKQLQDLVARLQGDMLVLKKNGPAAAPVVVLKEESPLKTLQERLERLEKLQDQDSATAQQVAGIKIQLSVLQETITGLQKDLDGVKSKIIQTEKSISLYPPADKQSLEEMRERLARMEKLLQDLQARPPYVAGSSPVPVPATGRIVVVNNSTEELLLLLNGQSQRVPAGSTLPLENRPVGTFSYEVISPTYGSLRRSSPALTAGETFTIRIQ